MKTNINFMGMRRYVYMLSGTLSIICLLSIFVFRGFNQGIDFSGGLTANLTINFEESDITKLRELFGNVRLERRFAMTIEEKILLQQDEGEESLAGFEPADVLSVDGSNVFYENLGTSIAGISASRPETRWQNESYVIRIKNMPGVDKDQIEEVLTSILSANFQPKTHVSFSVSSPDPNDTGAALGALLQNFQMGGSMRSSVIEEQNEAGERVSARRLFVVGQDFETLPFSEMEFRNTIMRFLLTHSHYVSEEPVEFTSTIDWGSFNAVSATIGAELQRSAIWLSLVCVLIMLFYMAIRFDFRFGVGAVVGLVHTMLIVLGLLSLTGREMNVTVVAAVLTAFGYAINDTIVIFDRIRENLQFSRKEDLLAVINRSVNAMLSRTIITSGTTLVACLAIYLFAGDVLRDFAFTLITGVVIGTCTSIFIASPTYYFMEKRMNRKVSIPA
jgi:preprotein translocase SecF subunit